MFTYFKKAARDGQSKSTLVLSSHLRDKDTQSLNPKKNEIQPRKRAGSQAECPQESSGRGLGGNKSIARTPAPPPWLKPDPDTELEKGNLFIKEKSSVNSSTQVSTFDDNTLD